MYKVLIVDDEFWALKGVESAFNWENYGFGIVGKTTNSIEAWDMICKLNPDVVFTDIQMPIITGLELAKRAFDKMMDIAFVLVSGFSDFSYAQQAIRNNVFDYCLKPIEEEEADEILKRLKLYLDNKEGNEESLSNEDKVEINNKEFRIMIDYINANFTDKLVLKKLSKKFFINESYCSSLFKKYFNSSFSDYMHKKRIQKSIALMKKDKNLSINDISVKVGFASYYHFNRIFKHVMGVTPSQYKKDVLNSDNELREEE